MINPSRGVRRCLCAVQALICLTLAGPVHAHTAPDACLTRSQIYSSELAAVRALVSCYAAHSVAEDREYIAAILRSGKGYRFVVGPGSAGDRVQLRFSRGPDETLAALWHTHGADGAHRSLFSPTDTQTARRLGIPFYLAAPSGELRVFRPRDRVRAPRLGSSLPPPRGSAAGALVDADWRAGLGA